MRYHAINLYMFPLIVVCFVHLATNVGLGVFKVWEYSIKVPFNFVRKIDPTGRSIEVMELPCHSLLDTIIEICKLIYDAAAMYREEVSAIS